MSKINGEAIAEALFRLFIEGDVSYAYKAFTAMRKEGQDRFREALMRIGQNNQAVTNELNLLELDEKIAIAQEGSMKEVVD